jgi:methylase of polypeptide subunit release factors
MSEDYINLGNYRVYTSDETDGFGYLTVKDAISCFHHFAQGRRFTNALEWCCGPGYFGFATLQTGLASNVSFSDISTYARDVITRTIDHNNLPCKFYLSDNFKHIPKQQFDLIVANPPHFNLELPACRDDGTVTEHEHRKMRDLNWDIHRNFFNTVNEYLTDDGKIMLMENVTGSNPDTFSKMLKENNLTITNYSQSIEHADYVYYIEISKHLAANN